MTPNRARPLPPAGEVSRKTRASVHQRARAGGRRHAPRTGTSPSSGTNDNPAQRHEDCPHPVSRHQGPELDRIGPTMGAMRIDEIYATGDRPVFSFEFFPPDARGRGEPVPRPGHPASAGPRLRQPHLRRRRLDARQDARDRLAHPRRVRPRGDGPLHLRGRDRRRAALHARRDELAGLRQRARPARRPAAGPGGVDEDRGRPRVLARARRAHQRQVRRSRSARPASPRRTSTRPRPRTTCATSRRRSTPASASSSPSSSSTTRSTTTSSPAPARSASRSRSCLASCRSRPTTSSRA